MRLGRVTGRLWSTVKSADQQGRRYLLVQPIDERGASHGAPFVCLDAVGAGAGETVYWARGREASLAFLPDQVSSDATVVGIVDRITLGDE